jgi:MFS family permease
MMLMAGWVLDVLHGGPGGLGLLISIGGIGSLAGSLVIASLPSRNRGKLFLGGALLLGGTLILFSLSTMFWVSAAIMVFVGVGQSFRMSLSNVLIQSYVADEFRGRVMSIYMMEFSLTSFGTFLIGVLAEVIGPQIAVGGTAVGLVALTLILYVSSPRLRNLH